MDHFRVKLEDAYTGNQLLCTYTLMHISGIVTTNARLKRPGSYCGFDGVLQIQTLQMPAIPRLSTPPTKRCRVRFETEQPFDSLMFILLCFPLLSGIIE